MRPDRQKRLQAGMLQPLRPRQARFFVAFMSCRASIRDGDTRSIATPVSWPRLLRNSIGECDGRKPK